MPERSIDNEDKSQDSRARAFRDRFRFVAGELGAKSLNDIESLKFRWLSNLYGYDKLLSNVDRITVEKVDGKRLGPAWKVTDNSGSAVILEEHETGLEVLYVVSSLSSIIALVQSIINALGKHRRNRYFPEELIHEQQIEKRKIVDGGKLEEDFIPSLEFWFLTHLIEQNERLVDRISSMEKQLQELKSSMGQSKKK